MSLLQWNKIMFGKYGQLWLEDVTRWRYVFEMLSFSDSMNTISGQEGVHWVYRLNVDWRLATGYIYSLIGWFEAIWSYGTCFVGRWCRGSGFWVFSRRSRSWWQGSDDDEGWGEGMTGLRGRWSGEEFISYIEIRLKNTWYTLLS